MKETIKVYYQSIINGEACVIHDSLDSALRHAVSEFKPLLEDAIKEKSYLPTLKIEALFMTEKDFNSLPEASFGGW